eukprot:TRINITY_DN2179_c0_g1_i2.p2 TRINITY_DN2179_c0_g1~~TRINITY_DN2179_c0_g1_i2.p2  ORF type:complete len:138 (-),score=19.64 TRINITY_DN2179_c0_g1_i2:548-961(-)
MQTTEDDVSLLVIIMDVNPFIWGQRANHTSNIDFSTFLEHVMAFINAYLMLNQQNMLAVIASNVNESKFLWPSTVEKEAKTDANNFSETRDYLLLKLREMVGAENFGKDDLISYELFRSSRFRSKVLWSTLTWFMLH